MTHRGPFQPLPFCDSVILRKSLVAARIKAAASFWGEGWGGGGWHGPPRSVGPGPMADMLRRAWESSRAGG